MPLEKVLHVTVYKNADGTYSVSELYDIFDEIGDEAVDYVTIEINDRGTLKISAKTE